MGDAATSTVSSHESGPLVPEKSIVPVPGLLLAGDEQSLVGQIPLVSRAGSRHLVGQRVRRLPWAGCCRRRWLDSLKVPGFSIIRDGQAQGQRRWTRPAVWARNAPADTSGDHRAGRLRADAPTNGPHTRCLLGASPKRTGRSPVARGRESSHASTSDALPAHGAPADAGSARGTAHRRMNR